MKRINYKMYVQIINTNMLTIYKINKRRHYLHNLKSAIEQMAAETKEHMAKEIAIIFSWQNSDFCKTS